jgi:hypothetical protein|tara:strand:+ start:377 stop:529 length:153 start_codon:yes stop_codon:yes gene_type:complete
MQVLNKREDILAEINLLKAIALKLWEDSHGKLSREDWREMKKEMIKKMRK